MALQPPHVGPQQIEHDEKPAISTFDRIVYLNRHFLIVDTFARQLTPLVQTSAIHGRWASEGLNVDGGPTMTEEEFEQLSAAAREMVDKVMDLHEHIRQILVKVAQIARRPVPPEWTARRNPTVP